MSRLQKPRLSRGSMSPSLSEEAGHPVHRLPRPASAVSLSRASSLARGPSDGLSTQGASGPEVTAGAVDISDADTSRDHISVAVRLRPIKYARTPCSRTLWSVNRQAEFQSNSSQMTRFTAVHQLCSCEHCMCLQSNWCFISSSPYLLQSLYLSAGLHGD